ncbi:WD repeat-containing protein 19 [Homalodisca vitripennis]|nr:WD repeat-containing protein 19 [Homalodisca vitripennis]
MSHIWYFLLEDWVQVAEFQHKTGCKWSSSNMSSASICMFMKYDVTVLSTTDGPYLVLPARRLGASGRKTGCKWPSSNMSSASICMFMKYDVTVLSTTDGPYLVLPARRLGASGRMGHIWYFLLEDCVQVVEFQHMGHIWYFLLEDWVQVTEFQHVISIKAVYPDMVGTRLIFIDAKSDGYIYNPVTDDLVLIPDLPTSAAGVLWDTWHPDRNVFIVYDSENMYTYIHIRDSITAMELMVRLSYTDYSVALGQRVVRVGVTKLPTDQIPLVLHSGLHRIDKVSFLEVCRSDWNVPGLELVPLDSSSSMCSI